MRRAIVIAGMSHAETGVFFPNCDIANKASVTFDACHSSSNIARRCEFTLAESPLRVEWIPEEPLQSSSDLTLRSLTDLLARSKAKNLIIFADDFGSTRHDICLPGMMSDLFARFDFTMDVALVVRPQAEQLEKAYLQRIYEISESRTFQDFVCRYGFSERYDHIALLSTWRRAAKNRIVVAPYRDCRSHAPIMDRLIQALDLKDQAIHLLSPRHGCHEVVQNSGPMAVEASRRLHALGLHRRITGHPSRVGRIISDLIRARGLDTQKFSGNARDTFATIEAYHGKANEWLASAYWGSSWDAIVARAPRKRPNELADQFIESDVEEAIERIVLWVLAHTKFQPPPLWLRQIDSLVERGIESISELLGRPI